MNWGNRYHHIFLQLQIWLSLMGRRRTTVFLTPSARRHHWWNVITNQRKWRLGTSTGHRTSQTLILMRTVFKLIIYSRIRIAWNSIAVTSEGPMLNAYMNILCDCHHTYFDLKYSTVSRTTTVYAGNCYNVNELIRKIMHGGYIAAVISVSVIKVVPVSFPVHPSIMVS